jgi:hypothetical protein
MMKYFTFACCSYLIFLKFWWELGAAASNRASKAGALDGS